MFLLKGNDEGFKTFSPVAQRPLTVGFKPCITNRRFKKGPGLCCLSHSGWIEKYDAFSIDLVRP